MKMLEFPELRQRYNYDCGAKAAQAVLAYYGIDVHENLIMKAARTKKSGTPMSGVERALLKYGIRCRIAKLTVQQIKKYIDKGYPVILLLQAWTKKKRVNWEKNWNDGHYAVAIGYDDNKIYFEDPYSVARTYLTYDELDERWHDIIGGRKYLNYGIVAYGKSHGFILQRFIHMD